MLTLTTSKTVHIYNNDTYIVTEKEILQISEGFCLYWQAGTRNYYEKKKQLKALKKEERFTDAHKLIDDLIERLKRTREA